MKQILFLLFTLIFAQFLRAEDIVFPADSGIINVKTKFGAKGDGVTDDTAALQKAIDETKGSPDTLYFPNGVYLVSGSLGIFNGKPHSADRFLNLQGQSEAGTVIRLKDQCPGFMDSAKSKIVLSLYEGQGTGDVMHSYVRNLSVDVGSGNPGAIGLRFLSNNTGAMDQVTIRSSDPKRAGKLGLDLRQGQNGPCLIKNVTVIGFDHGVETGDTFALVFEFLTLKDQNVMGFYNPSGRLTIRRLKSINSVPAMFNKANLTLIEADLTGGIEGNTAILNESKACYVRDVSQSGYGHILKDSEAVFHDSATLKEWHESRADSLFPTEAATLRLPIKETPEVPWETDLSKWVKVDWTKAGEDISAAFQGAIDKAAKENKSTVYIPRIPGGGSPKLTRPIRIHGSVTRILGMSNILDIDDPDSRFKRQAAFTFDEISNETVVFERFFLLGGWKCPPHVTFFENKTGKAVVVRNLTHQAKHKKPATSGEWFIEDVSANGLEIGVGEKCWARHYNPESGMEPMIKVDGGQLWILGLKTEGRETHVIARNRAKVEVLGGVSYQSWPDQPSDPPMFKVTDSDASFTLGFYHYDTPFETIVEETSKGITRTLPRKNLRNYHLPLYRSASTGPNTQAVDNASEWDSLAKEWKCPEWIQDAKLGLWLHWGPQSVPRLGGGWYARHMYIEPKKLGSEEWGKNAWEFHRKTYGHQSEYGYKELCRDWKAEKFDAESTMRQFTNWGARYVAIMGNHHDNYDLFNSSIHGWNTTRVGPKRDIVGEFAQAAKRHKLPWMVSIHASRAPSFFDGAFGSDSEGDKKGIPYDGALTRENGKGQWWEGLDPQQLYATHYTNFEHEFLQRATELVKNYEPDLLYYDDPQIPRGFGPAAALYAQSKARHGSIQAIVTVKSPQAGTMLDMEKGGAGELEPFYWQTDTTLAQDWFLKYDDGEKTLLHDPRSLVENITDIVSKNGSLMLNVAVNADGSVPEDQQKVLDSFGAWMHRYGEAIYNTRPWKTHGTGGAVKGGHFNERRRFNEPWGSDVIRFTRNKENNRLYLFVFGVDEPKDVTIEALARSSGHFSGQSRKVTLVGDGSVVKWSLDERGLHLALPKIAPAPHCAVLALDVDAL